MYSNGFVTQASENKIFLRSLCYSKQFINFSPFKLNSDIQKRFEGFFFEVQISFS